MGFLPSSYFVRKSMGSHPVKGRSVSFYFPVYLTGATPIRQAGRTVILLPTLHLSKIENAVMTQVQYNGMIRGLGNKGRG